MSDASQGPGWWQASDGKWYPPEQAPGGAPPPGAVPGGPPPGYGAPMGAGGVATLDVGTAISYGWTKFTKYLSQIIVILIVLIVVNVLFFFLRSSTDSLVFGLVFQVAGWIVSMIIQLGIVRVALDITAGREPDVANMFKTDRIGPYIIASILYGLAIFVGFFALCVGAFVAAFFLYFYPFFILDKGEEPVASLTSSFNLVKDNIGTLLVLAIVAFVISAVSCGFLSPVAWIAAAYAYKTLTGQPVAP